MLPHQRLQLAHHLRVPSERQIGLDAPLERSQPQFLQPGDLALRKPFVGEVRQRRPAPQRQRLAQPARRPPRIAAAQRQLGLRQRALKPCHIDIIGPDPKLITTRPRHQPAAIPGGALGPELLTQLRHIDVHALGRGRRRPLTPQLIDQPLRRDNLIAMQQQNGQQRPPLAATHDQRPTTTEDLKRAQQTEFHRDRPHPTLRPCSGSWQLATTTRNPLPLRPPRRRDPLPGAPGQGAHGQTNGGQPMTRRAGHVPTSPGRAKARASSRVVSGLHTNHR